MHLTKVFLRYHYNSCYNISARVKDKYSFIIDGIQDFSLSEKLSDPLCLVSKYQSVREVPFPQQFKCRELMNTMHNAKYLSNFIIFLNDQENEKEALQFSENYKESNLMVALPIWGLKGFYDPAKIHRQVGYYSPDRLITLHNIDNVLDNIKNTGAHYRKCFLFIDVKDIWEHNEDNLCKILDKCKAHVDYIPDFQGPTFSYT